MKIPGYKHLIEDVLPDLNNYTSELTRHVRFSYGDLSEVTEDLTFVFKRTTYRGHKLKVEEEKYSLPMMLKVKESDLRYILSWYLWIKYSQGGREICSEAYRDGHHLMPGEPPEDKNPDAATRTFEELDGNYVTLFHNIKRYDGIGMTMDVVPSKALNPIEVASWPIKAK
jgi:hypothetical protein